MAFLIVAMMASPNATTEGGGPYVFIFFGFVPSPLRVQHVEAKVRVERTKKLALFDSVIFYVK